MKTEENFFQGASHHPYRNLQSLLREQPYRTAYHFQPPKNWIYGMFEQPLNLFSTSYICFFQFYSSVDFVLYSCNWQMVAVEHPDPKGMSSQFPLSFAENFVNYMVF
jgi:sucrose-6-phosphate hydrolase SacC (GH32 family)